MTRPGPGKFEGNESLEVSEALYDIVGNSMYDESAGSVDELGWGALVLTTPAYIVMEDSNGFFSYFEYSSEASARAAWAELKEELEPPEEWHSDPNGPGDPYPVSWL